MEYRAKSSFAAEENQPANQGYSYEQTFSQEYEEDKNHDNEMYHDEGPLSFFRQNDRQELVAETPVIARELGRAFNASKIHTELLCRTQGQRGGMKLHFTIYDKISAVECFMAFHYFDEKNRLF